MGDVMAKDDMMPLFLIAGAGALAYILYENGTLASWFPSLFGTAAVTAPASTGSAPISTSVPVTATPTSPAPVTSVPMVPVSAPPAAIISPPVQSAANQLTVADAAQYPYSAGITAAQMNAIQAQLVTELQGGQIPSIAGDSVLAYMLGWGGQSMGKMESVAGETYTFDGTDWNLIVQGPPKTGASLTGLSASRVPLGMIHHRDYRFRRNG